MHGNKIWNPTCNEMGELFGGESICSGGGAANEGHEESAAMGEVRKERRELEGR
jgi:hypothetical protein